MTVRSQQAPVYIGRLDSRIETLENQNATTITEFWTSIPSGTTSGTLSPESGHEFVANQWQDGIDAIATGITGGVPNLQPVYTAAGVLVTATLNTTTGAWAYSGEPAGADPVALVTAQRAIGATAATLGAVIDGADEKTALVAGDKIGFRDVVSGLVEWISPANLLAGLKSILGQSDPFTDNTYTPANGATATHPYTSGNAFKLVVSARTTGEAITLAISGTPAGYAALTMIVVTGADVGFTFTRPTLVSGCTWPPLVASKTHIYTWETIDSGSTWAVSLSWVF